MTGRTRIGRITAGVACVIAVLAARGHAQAPLSIGALEWMAGSWAGAEGRFEHEEHWTAPKGGAMVGLHRTIGQGRMVAFEYFRIEEKNGALVYLSQPGGRSPATPFTAKAVDGQRVVFENLAHDFPQRIIYWREGDDLRARIEGARDGRARSMEWRWARATLAP